MRPAGEIHQALLNAATQLAESGGGTLSDLAEVAKVSKDAARIYVPKLKSRGHLAIVDTRRIPGRNRPAAVYMPAGLVEAAEAALLNLSTCMQAWAR